MITFPHPSRRTRWIFRLLVRLGIVANDDESRRYDRVDRELREKGQ